MYTKPTPRVDIYEFLPFRGVPAVAHRRWFAETSMRDFIFIVYAGQAMRGPTAWLSWFARRRHTGLGETCCILWRESPLENAGSSGSNWSPCFSLTCMLVFSCASHVSRDLYAYMCKSFSCVSILNKYLKLFIYVQIHFTYVSIPYICI